MSDEVEKLYSKLNRESEGFGYHLNSDEEHTLGLSEGLIKNEDRYGYRTCPCRLAEGDKEQGLDIICPCNYRDQDLSQYGTCYCGLYVCERFLNGKAQPLSIPERRPEEAQRKKQEPRKTHEKRPSSLALSGVPVSLCER